jgi:hypothetical protein
MQLNFFRKGVRSLEAVEPQVKAVADLQHIDYHFTELDDDLDDDDGDVYPDGDDNISNDCSELSFDYGQGKRASNATAQFPRKSLEVRYLIGTKQISVGTVLKKGDLWKE